ncbi:hypothetical protein GILI108418_06285 [Gillisia limnaea]|uniref:Uncharacterized protein n=1 Tax=Gillisia limnaea (strain DSM 15749 / LMG 21470 / R-8282) TaxID=865937 RepID=H2BSV7_GILLR|nr:hypothetical protein Gilli_0787 [Gillisia limnaea DSM 15749]
MFAEIVLANRFVLYLSHTVYSLASMVSAILLPSGHGSWLSSGLKLSLTDIRKIVPFMIFLLPLYAGYCHGCYWKAYVFQFGQYGGFPVTHKSPFLFYGNTFPSGSAFSGKKAFPKKPKKPVRLSGSSQSLKVFLYFKDLVEV